LPMLALLALAVSFGAWQPAAVLAADGVVTTTADSGVGSLREAILGATEGDTITFAIPGSGPHEIDLETPLPVLVEAITIDGSGEAIDGAPGVFIDGSGLDTEADGLVLTSLTGSYEISGLGIVG